MKRLSALGLVLVCAFALAFGATLVKSAVVPKAVGACGWYVYHLGTAVYDSYWNPALGKYANIKFQEETEFDGCSTGLSVALISSTDGYNMSGGTVITRVWENGSYWGSHGCPASGHNFVACYSPYAYGSPPPTGDDYQTTVYDAFGGVHSRYVSA